MLVGLKALNYPSKGLNLQIPKGKTIIRLCDYELLIRRINEQKN
jgi:hypothetical protein